MEIVDEEKPPLLADKNEEFNLNLPEEENGAGPEEMDFPEKEVFIEELELDRKSDIRGPRGNLDDVSYSFIDVKELSVFKP